MSLPAHGGPVTFCHQLCPTRRNVITVDKHRNTLLGWPLLTAAFGLWQPVISLAWHVTALTSGHESCCCVEGFTSCWFASFSPTTAPAAKSVMHKHIPAAAGWCTHIWQTFSQHLIASLRIFFNVKDITVGSRRICRLLCHLLQGAEISQGTNAFWLGGVLFHQSHHLNLMYQSRKHS